MLLLFSIDNAEMTAPTSILQSNRGTMFIKNWSFLFVGSIQNTIKDNWYTDSQDPIMTKGGG
jgi:hypothetical protein